MRGCSYAAAASERRRLASRRGILGGWQPYARLIAAEFALNSDKEEYSLVLFINHRGLVTGVGGGGGEHKHSPLVLAFGNFATLAAWFSASTKQSNKASIKLFGRSVLCCVLMVIVGWFKSRVYIRFYGRINVQEAKKNCVIKQRLDAFLLKSPDLLSVSWGYLTGVRVRVCVRVCAICDGGSAPETPLDSTIPKVCRFTPQTVIYRHKTHFIFSIMLPYSRPIISYNAIKQFHRNLIKLFDNVIKFR